ncbi:hypothetical protein [Paraflavitalea speifideaquila]
MIEHIHDQPKLIAAMKGLLNPGGCIFLVFHPGKCHSEATSRSAKENG